ncbi:24217_t:CDS:2, partial [Racocetra persica]
MATSMQRDLSAADYNFTKLSITPFSFYTGQVYISLKDTTFQASSALRHATEFYDSIEQNYLSANSLPEIVIVYTVKVLITDIILVLFNWANLAERIIFILNLGFQRVALQQEQMSTESE